MSVLTNLQTTMGGTPELIIPPVRPRLKANRSSVMTMKEQLPFKYKARLHEAITYKMKIERETKRKPKPKPTPKTKTKPQKPKPKQASCPRICCPWSEVKGRKGGRHRFRNCGSYATEEQLDDLSMFDEYKIHTCLKCWDARAQDWAVTRAEKLHKTEVQFLLEGLDDTPAFTGMFRDNQRRIDYVLVLSASRDEYYTDDIKAQFLAMLVKVGFELEIEQGVIESASRDEYYTDDIKAQFLAMLVKVGFELEIEQGVLKEHNNLLFVKVHATDVLLDSYSEYYGVKKDFQDNHTSYMGPINWFAQGSRLWLRDEKEWIRLLRRRYFRPTFMSNRDRSYITYMIIKHQPFGENDKNYGFHRLLQRKIVIDGYALHDGPYFLTAEQPVAVINGRQILYYNWANRMFVLQPLNIIYEYFGPKIAMYFTFYQFYLGMLAGLTMFAVLTLIAWLFYYIIILDKKGLCTKKFLQPAEYFEAVGWKRDGLTSCPPCQDFKACPVLIQNCWIWTFVTYWRYYYYFLPLFTAWVLLFFVYWRKKYNHYRWLWELRHMSKNSIVRAEYTVKYMSAKRSKIFGLWRTRITLNQVLVWPLDCIIFLISLTTIIAMMISTYYIRNYVLAKLYADKKLTVNPVTATVDPNYNKAWYDSRIFYSERMENVTMNEIDIYLLVCSTVVQVFVFYFFERCFLYLCPKMVSMENHRLFKNYERSVVYRMFACSLIFKTSVLMYTTFVKGRFYRHPLSHWKQYINISTPFFNTNLSVPWLGTALYFSCRNAYCLDETVTIMATSILAYSFILMVESTCSHKTDYNVGKQKVDKVPEWEREFKLKPLSEEKVMRWYNSLLIEYTMIAWFGPHFIVIVLVIFPLRLYLLRKHAMQLVKNYRRPTIINMRGLTAFNNILIVVTLTTALFHALASTRMWKPHSYSINIEAHFKNLGTVKDEHEGSLLDKSFGPGLLGVVPEFDKQYLKMMPGNKFDDNEKKVAGVERSFEFCQPQFISYVRHNQPYFDDAIVPFPFNRYHIFDNTSTPLVMYSHTLAENYLEAYTALLYFIASLTLLLVAVYDTKPDTEEVARRFYKEKQIRRYATHEWIHSVEEDPMESNLKECFALNIEYKPKMDEDEDMKAVCVGSQLIPNICPAARRLGRKRKQICANIDGTQNEPPKSRNPECPASDIYFDTKDSPLGSPKRSHSTYKMTELDRIYGDPNYGNEGFGTIDVFEEPAPTPPKRTKFPPKPQPRNLLKKKPDVLIESGTDTRERAILPNKKVQEILPETLSGTLPAVTTAVQNVIPEVPKRESKQFERRSSENLIVGGVILKSSKEWVPSLSKDQFRREVKFKDHIEIPPVKKIELIKKADICSSEEICSTIRNAIKKFDKDKPCVNIEKLSKTICSIEDCRIGTCPEASVPCTFKKSTKDAETSSNIIISEKDFKKTPKEQDDKVPQKTKKVRKGRGYYKKPRKFQDENSPLPSHEIKPKDKLHKALSKDILLEKKASSQNILLDETEYAKKTAELMSNIQKSVDSICSQLKLSASHKSAEVKKDAERVCIDLKNYVQKLYTDCKNKAEKIKETPNKKIGKADAESKSSFQDVISVKRIPRPKSPIPKSLKLKTKTSSATTTEIIKKSQSSQVLDKVRSKTLKDTASVTPKAMSDISITPKATSDINVIPDSAAEPYDENVCALLKSSTEKLCATAEKLNCQLKKCYIPDIIKQARSESSFLKKEKSKDLTISSKSAQDVSINKELKSQQDIEDEKLSALLKSSIENFGTVTSKLCTQLRDFTKEKCPERKKKKKESEVEVTKKESKEISVLPETKVCETTEKICTRLRQLVEGACPSKIKKRLQLSKSASKIMLRNRSTPNLSERDKFVSAKEPLSRSHDRLTTEKICNEIVDIIEHICPDIPISSKQLKEIKAELLSEETLDIIKRTVSTQTDILARREAVGDVLAGQTVIDKESLRTYAEESHKELCTRLRKSVDDVCSDTQSECIKLRELAEKSCLYEDFEENKNEKDKKPDNRVIEHRVSLITTDKEGSSLKSSIDKLCCELKCSAEMVGNENRDDVEKLCADLKHLADQICSDQQIKTTAKPKPTQNKPVNISKESNLRSPYRMKSGISKSESNILDSKKELARKPSIESSIKSLPDVDKINAKSKDIRNKSPGIKGVTQKQRTYKYVRRNIREIDQLPIKAKKDISKPKDPNKIGPKPKTGVDPKEKTAVQTLKSTSPVTPKEKDVEPPKERSPVTKAKVSPKTKTSPTSRPKSPGTPRIKTPATTRARIPVSPREKSPVRPREKSREKALETQKEYTKARARTPVRKTVDNSGQKTAIPRKKTPVRTRERTPTKTAINRQPKTAVTPAPKTHQENVIKTKTTTAQEKIRTKTPPYPDYLKTGGKKTPVTTKPKTPICPRMKTEEREKAAIAQKSAVTPKEESIITPRPSISDNEKKYVCPKDIQGVAIGKDPCARIKEEKTKNKTLHNAEDSKSKDLICPAHEGASRPICRRRFVSPEDAPKEKSKKKDPCDFKKGKSKLKKRKSKDKSSLEKFSAKVAKKIKNKMTYLDRIPIKKNSFKCYQDELKKACVERQKSMSSSHMKSASEENYEDGKTPVKSIHSKLSSSEVKFSDSLIKVTGSKISKHRSETQVKASDSKITQRHSGTQVKLADEKTIDSKTTLSESATQVKLDVSSGKKLKCKKLKTLGEKTIKPSKILEGKSVDPIKSKIDQLSHSFFGCIRDFLPGPREISSICRLKGSRTCCRDLRRNADGTSSVIKKRASKESAKGSINKKSLGSKEVHDSRQVGKKTERRKPQESFSDDKKRDSKKDKPDCYKGVCVPDCLDEVEENVVKQNKSDQKVNERSENMAKQIKLDQKTDKRTKNMAKEIKPNQKSDEDNKNMAIQIKPVKADEHTKYKAKQVKPDQKADERLANTKKQHSKDNIDVGKKDELDCYKGLCVPDCYDKSKEESKTADCFKGICVPECFEPQISSEVKLISSPTKLNVSSESLKITRQENDSMYSIVNYEKTDENISIPTRHKTAIKKAEQKRKLREADNKPIPSLYKNKIEKVNVPSVQKKLRKQELIRILSKNEDAQSRRKNASNNENKETKRTKEIIIKAKVRRNSKLEDTEKEEIEEESSSCTEYVIVPLKDKTIERDSDHGRKRKIIIEVKHTYDDSVEVENVLHDNDDDVYQPTLREPVRKGDHAEISKGKKKKQTYEEPLNNTINDSEQIVDPQLEASLEQDKAGSQDFNDVTRDIMTKRNYYKKVKQQDVAAIEDIQNQRESDISGEVNKKKNLKLRGGVIKNMYQKDDDDDDDMYQDDVSSIISDEESDELLRASKKKNAEGDDKRILKQEIMKTEEEHSDHKDDDSSDDSDSSNLPRKINGSPRKQRHIRQKDIAEGEINLEQTDTSSLDSIDGDKQMKIIPLERKKYMKREIVEVDLNDDNTTDDTEQQEEKAIARKPKIKKDKIGTKDKTLDAEKSGVDNEETESSDQAEKQSIDYDTSAPGGGAEIINDDDLESLVSNEEKLSVDHAKDKDIDNVSETHSGIEIENVTELNETQSNIENDEEEESNREASEGTTTLLPPRANFNRGESNRMYPDKDNELSIQNPYDDEPLHPSCVKCIVPECMDTSGPYPTCADRSLPRPDCWQPRRMQELYKEAADYAETHTEETVAVTKSDSSSKQKSSFFRRKSAKKSRDRKSTKKSLHKKKKKDNLESESSSDSEGSIVDKIDKGHQSNAEEILAYTEKKIKKKEKKEKGKKDKQRKQKDKTKASGSKIGTAEISQTSENLSEIKILNTKGKIVTSKTSQTETPHNLNPWSADLPNSTVDGTHTLLPPKDLSDASLDGATTQKVSINQSTKSLDGAPSQKTSMNESARSVEGATTEKISNNLSTRSEGAIAQGISNYQSARQSSNQDEIIYIEKPSCAQCIVPSCLDDSSPYPNCSSQFSKSDCWGPGRIKALLEESEDYAEPDSCCEYVQPFCPNPDVAQPVTSNDSIKKKSIFSRKVTKKGSSKLSISKNKKKKGRKHDKLEDSKQLSESEGVEKSKSEVDDKSQYSIESVSNKKNKKLTKKEKKKLKQSLSRKLSTEEVDKKIKKLTKKDKKKLKQGLSRETSTENVELKDVPPESALKSSQGSNINDQKSPEAEHSIPETRSSQGSNTNNQNNLPEKYTIPNAKKIVEAHAAVSNVFLNDSTNKKVTRKALKREAQFYNTLEMIPVASIHTTVDRITSPESQKKTPYCTESKTIKKETGRETFVVQTSSILPGTLDSVKKIREDICKENRTASKVTISQAKNITQNTSIGLRKTVKNVFSGLKKSFFSSGSKKLLSSSSKIKTNNLSQKLQFITKDKRSSLKGAKSTKSKCRSAITRINISLCRTKTDNIQLEDLEQSGCSKFPSIKEGITFGADNSSYSKSIDPEIKIDSTQSHLYDFDGRVPCLLKATKAFVSGNTDEQDTFSGSINTVHTASPFPLRTTKTFGPDKASLLTDSENKESVDTSKATVFNLKPNISSDYNTLEKKPEKMSINVSNPARFLKIRNTSHNIRSCMTTSCNPATHVSFKETMKTISSAPTKISEEASGDETTILTSFVKEKHIVHIFGPIKVVENTCPVESVCSRPSGVKSTAENICLQDLVTRKSSKEVTKKEKRSDNQNSSSESEESDSKMA